MKYFLAALLLIPFCLFSQDDDYCPCMDEPYEDIMNMVSSSIDDDFVAFTPASDAPYVQQVNYEDVPLVLARAEEPEVIEKAPTPMYGGSWRYPALKKSRRKYRPRIKFRAGKRKYRGQCPMF